MNPGIIIELLDADECGELGLDESGRWAMWHRITWPDGTTRIVSLWPPAATTPDTCPDGHQPHGTFTAQTQQRSQGAIG